MKINSGRQIPAYWKIRQKWDELNARFSKALNATDLAELRQIIIDNEIVCPVSGTRNWTDVRQFNLMFSTEMGSTLEGSHKIYLRPETAQGIFVNFLNVQKTGRMKIPFGIAQIGKAFRNEIVARQFIFRMREFEQMEMQYFVQPGTELDWFRNMEGGPDEMALSRLVSAMKTTGSTIMRSWLIMPMLRLTLNIRFPFGFKEVEGIHSRTDFDLSQHQKYQRKEDAVFRS